MKKTTITLEEGFDWDKECKRKVKEFPMYAGRLQEIDYKSVIASRIDWKDPNFAPSVNQLIETEIRGSSRHEKWRNYTWKRPQEVYGDGNFILYDSPGPNDIKQGRLGDCYFLASLSALAEFPHRIDKVFITKEVNEAGCYAVTLYVNGEKRTVVVDDYFPYCDDSQTWAFSQPSKTAESNNEIWVLVLEKAWAKVFGSYQRIEAGTAGEAMYPLTGSPTQQFFLNDVRDLDGFWQRIVMADRRKFPMTCCTISYMDKHVDAGQMNAKGLQDTHAYTLIGAKTVTLADLSTERLLKIRNPYGQKEWIGDWGDNSKKWTVRLRAQVNGENKEDGIFFMCLADFVKFFTIATVCYYIDDIHDNYLVDQHEVGAWAMAKFTLERDNLNPLCVTVDQISERFLDRKRDGGYIAAPTKVILTKLDTRVRQLDDENESQELKFVQTFVGGERKQQSHVTATFCDGLPKGVYVALYQSEFNSEVNYPERKLVFSVYCGQPIQNMQRVSLEDYKQGNIDTFESTLQKRLEQKMLAKIDEYEEEENV